MDMIFKGATRPAMVLGIPLMPLVIAGLTGVLLTMWALQILGAMAGALSLAVTVVLLGIMRVVSKADDQKLNQMLLRLQSWPARRNAHYWGAHSSSPNAYSRSL